MVALSNPKHELFAQELAKGKTADEAYVLAGYKANRGNASTLKANQNVLDRVSELQRRAADRVEVTLQSLMDEAEEVRRLACAAGQYAPAIAAIREKGVLSGHRVDRKEVGNPGDFARMDDAELDAFIADRERAVRDSASREGVEAHSPVSGGRGRLN